MAKKLKPLEPPDDHHLTAAEGWLELGDWLEANEELERIRPRVRAHPSVLQVRWKVYAKAKKWELALEVARAISEMLPDTSWGFIHYAFSLHELKRTKKAYAVLIPIADQFSDWVIPYNLACYSCQLGQLKESKEWLEKAIAAAGKTDLRIMALEDADLKPLWKEIGNL